MPDLNMMKHNKGVGGNKAMLATNLGHLEYRVRPFYWIVSFNCRHPVCTDNNQTARDHKLIF